MKQKISIFFTSSRLTRKKKIKSLNTFWSLALNSGVYFLNTNSELGQKDAAEMMHGTRLGAMPAPSLGPKALAL